MTRSGSSFWYTKGIPKHKTLTWLSNSRPFTLSWGISTDPTCLLCNNHLEFRGHIFFTRSVWRPLSSKLGLNLPSDSWDDTTRTITNLLGTIRFKFLARIAWQMVI
ncbi:hypothetical protein YC2023_082596 [Brassica napus]